jgi:GDP/UDP-N,N'-diacetylbacillosamine 2-epimerase (hydrolysing)
MINQLIDDFVNKNSDRAISFVSLGQLKYLSAIKYCKVVIGNSSSGLIEVPSFKKATINIGDRQKGRVQAKSVISCKPEMKAIVESIQTALSDEFQLQLQNVENPYGEGNSSYKIVEAIQNASIQNILKKEFYNLPNR